MLHLFWDTLYLGINTQNLTNEKVALLRMYNRAPWRKELLLELKTAQIYLQYLQVFPSLGQICFISISERSSPPHCVLDGYTTACVRASCSLIWDLRDLQYSFVVKIYKPSLRVAPNISLWRWENPFPCWLGQLTISVDTQCWQLVLTLCFLGTCFYQITAKAKISYTTPCYYPKYEIWTIEKIGEQSL